MSSSHKHIHFTDVNNNNNNNNSRYAGQLEFFVGAKFYCPHALADGNQRIRTREKTLEFSSAVLSTLSRYVITTINSSSNNNLRVTWYHIRVLLR